MSVSVQIITENKDIDFSKFLISFAKRGYRIVSRLSDDNDFCQFYLQNESTRTIDISKEDYGYEVRITTFANFCDYKLFSETLQSLAETSAGKTYYEETLVDNIAIFFDHEWIMNQIESDYTCVFALVNHSSNNNTNGSEIKLFGPNSTFCIGKLLFEKLNIDKNTPIHIGHKAIIDKMLYSQYSRPSDIRRTSTSLVIQGENGEEDKTVTIYAKNDFDMISKADIMALKVNDNSFIFLEYADFMKIVPSSWELFDNSQYFTQDLSEEEWYELIKQAKEYELFS